MCMAVSIKVFCSVLSQATASDVTVSRVVCCHRFWLHVVAHLMTLWIRKPPCLLYSELDVVLCSLRWMWSEVVCQMSLVVFLRSVWMPRTSCDMELHRRRESWVSLCRVVLGYTICVVWVCCVWCEGEMCARWGCAVCDVRVAVHGVRVCHVGGEGMWCGWGVCGVRECCVGGEDV